MRGVIAYQSRSRYSALHGCLGVRHCRVLALGADVADAAPHGTISGIRKIRGFAVCIGHVSSVIQSTSFQRYSTVAITRNATTTDPTKTHSSMAALCDVWPESKSKRCGCNCPPCSQPLLLKQRVNGATGCAFGCKGRKDAL